MNIEPDLNRKVHHGHNIKRLREMLGVKQEVIAIELDITQQAVSGLEQKELIDDTVLNKIAQIMKIPVEAIKNMTDDSTHNYINTFNEAVTNHNGFYNFNCSFNPIDKIVELYTSKMELYERMLKAEQEKNALLEKLLNDKK
ncbi:helix-turn-helix transcriptional regulator [Dysgonomonas sp. Marseille-P4677]|uniref:helix-turn-helix domain-containing protein n=1 Tax=Dysgonomonas sp. Marseille-P4677 TaxID=2364790 RepID=UPI0019137918|nr:helix-turn-helix transcriptional regulator [Dysgonomonas sp. Marseille-P4677]MBK5721864.1 helix-turn-helix transcriptional regulator [Dysgonomonas sp. Marseille-P4677]